jgi:hypothetical protein
MLCYADVHMYIHALFESYLNWREKGAEILRTNKTSNGTYIHTFVPMQLSMAIGGIEALFAIPQQCPIVWATMVHIPSG